ncbi:hypothetical protein HDE_13419 [Halotydeus destructor]|nr:hypothetical protein HDE_13419 [Halotydeus destructor]
MKFSFALAALCCSAAIVSAQLGGSRFGPSSYQPSEDKLASRASQSEPQYEAQTNSAQYSSAPYRPLAAAQSYNAPATNSYQPEGQSYPSRGYGRQTSQTYGAAQPASSKPSAQNDGTYSEEEAEKDKQPTKLELLLAQSKFACSSKKDGYYADSSVACQVFHYCVGGAKHSWMCPEGTVFHQVHLNCVPASQDICSRSESFYLVNDYLHKEIDQKGPNNTIRYHQRYYPEEFLGDIFSSLPQEPAQKQPARQSSQSYPAQSQPQPQRQQSYPSYKNEDDYGSSQSQPSSYPANSYQPSYAPAAAPKQSSQSYPSNYPSNYANSAASSKPAAATYSAPSSSYQQPRAQPQSSYSSPDYSPSYSPSASKPAAAQAAYSPSSAYSAQQPAYKKVQASSITLPRTQGYQAQPSPAAPAYSPSTYQPQSSYQSVAKAQQYPAPQAYSAGGSGRYTSSLVDNYNNLKSGVTYEEDY